VSIIARLPPERGLVPEYAGAALAAAGIHRYQRGAVIGSVKSAS